MAGVSRQQYTTEIKIIRVMCTGRVDLSFILRTFLKGADGVFIGGCWPGECHYANEGNYDALANMHIARKLLKHIGLNPERIRLEWISAAQGSRFAEVIDDFIKNLKILGPLGIVEGVDSSRLKFKLNAVNKLIPYIKLVEREKLRAPLKSEEAYNKFYASDAANRLFNEFITDKLALMDQDKENFKKSLMDNNRIDHIIDKHNGKASSLIQVLLEIQSENHWLPREVLYRVSERLKVPLSQVLEIVTFYKTFRLIPEEQHELKEEYAEDKFTF